MGDADSAPAQDTMPAEQTDQRVDKAMSSEEEESDDDSLVLEGAIVRNPDVLSSSEEDSEEDDEVKEKAPSKGVTGISGKRKAASKPRTKKKKKKPSNEPETVQVDFTFCDMDERFFHGLKALLHESSTVYQRHSSALADLMIENISVGTVVSTEGDTDGNVYGFASVLNVTTYQESPAIHALKDVCLAQCPKQHVSELQVVLSGKTKRPAGFLMHARMINLPLEIVHVLHQQLVLDMDWAIEHAEGGAEERKSLDFGAFVRLAPCTCDGGATVYRYFDDEVFAGQAEFCYTIDAPKSFSKEDKQFCNVMVLTKTGHRAAMKDLAKLIHGHE